MGVEVGSELDARRETRGMNGLQPEPELKAVPVLC